MTWRLAGGLGLVATVIVLSLIPDPFESQRFEQVKVGHFLAYGVTMLWFAQTYRATSARIGVAVGLALLGVGLEYAQGMIGYRIFAYSDMRDDALGVLAGFVLGVVTSNRAGAGWATGIWGLLTVFVVPLLSPGEILGWLVLGATLGLGWKFTQLSAKEK